MKPYFISFDPALPKDITQVVVGYKDPISGQITIIKEMKKHKREKRAQSLGATIESRDGHLWLHALNPSWKKKESFRIHPSQDHMFDARGSRIYEASNLLKGKWFVVKVRNAVIIALYSNSLCEGAKVAFDKYYNLKTGSSQNSHITLDANRIDWIKEPTDKEMYSLRVNNKSWFEDMFDKINEGDIFICKKGVKSKRKLIFVKDRLYRSIHKGIITGENGEVLGVANSGRTINWFNKRFDRISSKKSYKSLLQHEISRFNLGEFNSEGLMPLGGSQFIRRGAMKESLSKFMGNPVLEYRHPVRSFFNPFDARLLDETSIIAARGFGKTITEKRLENLLNKDQIKPKFEEKVASSKGFTLQVNKVYVCIEDVKIGKELFFKKGNEYICHTKGKLDFYFRDELRRCHSMGLLSAQSGDWFRKHFKLKKNSSKK